MTMINTTTIVAVTAAMSLGASAFAKTRAYDTRRHRVSSAALHCCGTQWLLADDEFGLLELVAEGVSRATSASK
jgi:hypothetical protein